MCEVYNDYRVAKTSISFCFLINFFYFIFFMYFSSPDLTRLSFGNFAFCFVRCLLVVFIVFTFYLFFEGELRKKTKTEIVAV